MRESDRRRAEGFLFTDQYQLTMAHVYFRMGLHERPAQFEHFFRTYPNYGNHQAGYCINAGLEWLIDRLEKVHIQEQDIDYLRHQRGRGGRRLFEDDFLDWLSDAGHFRNLHVRAVPEGRVVHPNTPLTVVRGPMAVAQILETSLLNLMNYQVLVASKASRIRHAGRGGAVLEFGLRRAQDKGANAATRAALIGGADFTSNSAMSGVLGLPPKGTHAHSLVQAFMAMGEGELGAFRAYADVYPDDCVLLVDTIDTLGSGIPNAIKVFEDLRRRGHKPVGIRLDSGDLAHLSIQAARMLDQAGFEDVSILLSSELDELNLWQITTQIEQEAPDYGVDPDALIRRFVYGVGTRLVVSEGDPALGGVYKLVALQDGQEWKPAIKLSDSALKTPNPGDKLLWRVYDQRGKATADLLALSDENPAAEQELELYSPTEHTVRRILRSDRTLDIEPLLVDVQLDGETVYERPGIKEIRRLRDEDLAKLDPGVKRLVNPHRYHVSLTRRLFQMKRDLIEQFQPRG